MSESNNVHAANEPGEAEGGLEPQLPATSPENISAEEKPEWGRLINETLRTSFLKHPRWEGIPASPVIMLILVTGYILATLCLQRLAIAGPADFHFRAIGANWFAFASWAWLCFSLRRDPVKPDGSNGSKAPSASHLFVLSMAQGLFLFLILNLPFGLSMYLGWITYGSFSQVISWLIYLVPLLLTIAIQSVFLWRACDRRAWSVVLIFFVTVSSIAMQITTRPPHFWYPKRVESSEADSSDRTPDISQEVFEAQAALFQEKMSGLQPQRTGIIDLYSLNFAPYGDENVFLNETSMVTQVMEKRFDAAGRSLQLVNNPGTMNSLPWATPLNLQRAIQHVAKRMDVNEDILFLHMSSHGASDGELSAGMWPLTVNTVTPEDLKRWLDEAGIKHRVISISACYAGNWIAPLSDADTLVMTASDADHTSYGCGSKSDLTFFGRAMYDEQLRNKTLSFETALASARPIIKQREEEAGKTDGYSNPQIAMGANIRDRLKLLELRLSSAQPLP